VNVIGALRVGSLPVLLLSCVGVYWVGLNGPFLFDDFANLPALLDYGGVRNFETLRLYLLNGIAGPTGRPISLLSFLIDSNAWPYDPWPFKYTNLLLHLLTGCLLLWLAFRLALKRGWKEMEAGWVAFLIAGFWLLHPLNLSTTLYVVQRMAILSALFSLVGLLAYVHGRAVLATNPLRGYLWMSAALVIGTLLATLSKENGAVLPALALVLEGTLLSGDRGRRPAMVWRAVFLWLPTLALMAYLLYAGITGRGYDSRSFTVSERLLTEGRVLVDYLYHWFLPFAPLRGLFVDNYPVSTSLFNPLSTLFAWGGLIAVAAGSLRYRKRYPSLTCAIWFFLAGHLVESTTLSLELYFEHRNYLPAMLLVLPVAESMVEYSRKQRLLPVLLGVLLIGMAATTHRLARIWSDELRSAYYWLEQNPGSSRAQGWAATTLERLGHSEAALVVLTRAVERRPDDLHLHLQYIVQACYTGGLSEGTLAVVLEKFRQIPFPFQGYPLVEHMVETLPDPHCMGLGFEYLHALLDVLADNPGMRGGRPMSRIQYLRGVLYIKQGLPKNALAAFRESLRLRPETGAGLSQTALLAGQGYYAEALALLDTVKTLPVSDPGLLKSLSTLNYPSEIEHLQRTIEEDLRQQHKAGVQPPQRP
jgi:tetratricopeptide (TPR) repeat protein